MMERPPHQTEQDVRRLDTSSVEAFLELAPDGTVTVYTGKVELGTGVQTSLAQIVAVRFGVPLDRATHALGEQPVPSEQALVALARDVEFLRMEVLHGHAAAEPST